MSDTSGSPDVMVIERRFEAPVALLWKMWTDPEHFRGWYGPNGASLPVVEMDVRVGGSRLVCMEMQAPNGPMQMWFAGEYREVVEHVRLVYTEFMSDENGNPSNGAIPDGHPTTTEVRVDSEDVESGTRLVLTHRGVAADSPGAGGWAMALDTLAASVRVSKV